MEMHEREVEDAKQRIAASGRSPEDFSFDVEFHPPDPDGGGMFTIRYDVAIANRVTERRMMVTGGIGLPWVDYFEGELKEGYFD